MVMKNRLIDDCATFAIELLQKYGEFFPFAFAVLKDNDNFVSIQPNIDNNNPLSDEVIANLEDSINKLHQTNDFVAACICSNVVVNKDKRVFDAIEIRIDIQKSGNSNIYIPYSIVSGVVVLKEGYETRGSFFLFDSFEKHGLINEDTEIYILKSIMSGDEPIRLVVHDIDDNWQFLTGTDISLNDLTIKKLKDVLTLDSSIIDILYIGKGFEAFRYEANTTWQILKSN